MRKYFTIIGLLGIAEIGITLYLTYWRKEFWNFVEVKDYRNFLIFLGIFSVVALLYCFIAALSGYISNLTVIEWRKKLNAKAITLKSSALENVNQRVQEDCSSYPELFINLGCGFIKAVVYLMVFSVTLSLSFTYKYLIIIILYGIMSTMIAKKIANPLIGLNYMSQKAEASYRNDLNESNFKYCLNIMLELAKKNKRLQYFQSFYSQMAVIIPIIIVAPAYFTTGMLLGSLMQAISTMGTISDNLSFGINSFTSINKLLSCKKRLKELGVL